MANKIIMSQSKLIKQLRGDLTQKQFAEKVGEKHQYISRWEKGETAISLKKFINMCDKMNFEFQLKSRA